MGNQMLNIDNKVQKRIIVISAIVIVIICICGYFFSVSNNNHPIATIMINEYMIHNTNTLYDGDWDTSDWIEIYNYGQERIWLGDIYISDDSEIPLKFLLPDRYIDADEYIIIFASAKESSDTEIHVSFKLGDKDTAIVLSYGEDEIIDICKIEILPQDVSAGINDAGQWRYYATPTPNSKNDTPESETSDITPVDSDLKKIIINEYMCNNEYTLKDSRGVSVDWIELYNPSNESVWIDNLYISDNPQKPNKFLLPDYCIGPGEYLLIYADSKMISTDTQIYAPFSLSADEQIILSNCNGKIIDKREVQLLPCDISAPLHRDMKTLHLLVYLVISNLLEKLSQLFILMSL